MRILVAGAGAVGGYFGGRLAEKGEDVTFLLRPVRQSLINAQGLTIKSAHGDIQIPVNTINRNDARVPFDLIIVSSKAYQLNGIVDDITAYVGPASKILPLLNGYAHYELLAGKFGKDKILGGLCFIESTLGPGGEILQTSPQHRITFGSFTGNNELEEQIADHLKGANFELNLSNEIMREIWIKYTYITCLSGMTSLMQAPLGMIREDKWGWKVYQQLVNEVIDIASKAGFPADEDCKAKLLNLVRTNHPGLKSSMQRDMEKGLPVEADHLHGYLLHLASKAGADLIYDYPLLSTVYANLNIYQNQINK
ncbi:MAG: ketopantoate reductase family protein [Methylocystaceae bacterium]